MKVKTIFSTKSQYFRTINSFRTTFAKNINKSFNVSGFKSVVHIGRWDPKIEDFVSTLYQLTRGVIACYWSTNSLELEAARLDFILSYIPDSVVGC